MMLPRLPILATLLGAYLVVFTNLGVILRATMLPLVILVVINTFGAAFEGVLFVNLLTWALSLPFATLCAVVIHRTVLLGPESLTNRWSLSWSNRETNFMIWLIILGVFFYLARMAFLAVGWMLPELWMYILAAAVFGVWIEGRFSMVLPATAIDRQMILSRSWYLTSGNDLQLIVVLGVPILLFIAAVSMLGSSFSLAGTIFNTAILLVSIVITVAVEIAALSLSYQFLIDAAETE